MTTETSPGPSKAAQVLRHPRLRRIAIWLVSIFVALGVILGLAAPPLLRGKLASILSDKFHRPVTLEQIKINPYTMTVALRGLLMKERQGGATALSFEELFIDLDIRSLLRLAPVVEELKLTKPYVTAVRHTDGKYNFQDLIDEFTSGPPGPTPRFALNNIQIVDGKIDFDDQPEQTQHSVTGIKLGLPFISSLAAHVAIKVKPELSAVVNGAPFHFTGESTTPFKDTLESSLSFKIDKLAIAKYLEYAPVALNFKVLSGALDGEIKANFKSAPRATPALALSGDLRVSGLEMQQINATPLLKLPQLDVVVESLRVFADSAGIKSVRAQGLELHVSRDKRGEINLAQLIAPAPSHALPPAKNDESKPFAYQIDEIAVDGATVHFADAQPARPYKTRLDSLSIKIAGLSGESGKKANVEVAFETEAKETFHHSGALQLTPLWAAGKLNLTALNAAALAPYYQDALEAEVKDGRVDLSAQYSFEDKSGQPDIKLTQVNAALRNFRLEQAGQPEPLWRVGSLALKDGQVDVANKSLAFGIVEAKDGAGYIQRDKDGRLNLERIAKPQPPAPAQKIDDDWKIEAKQLLLDRFRISFDDRSIPTPAKSVLSDLTVRIANFSTAKNSPAKLTLRTTINEKGTLQLVGTATANPPAAKLAVEGTDVELLPFQPYLEDQVQFIVTGGRAGTKGNLLFDGAGTGPAKLTYNGTIDIADFATIEKANSQDLLKWKSLNLGAIQFNLKPFQLRIDEINLGDFYSRLILGADGRINLQKLAGDPGAQSDGAAPPPGGEEKQAAKPAAQPANPVTIGRINLQGGNIRFTDLFIKPNYNANLTNVQGAISELKADTPGDLDIEARLDGSAPVVIKGKLNPLSSELFLDMVADAKEIELSPMTPYSGRYVGYGIEKGKLSFNVKYKLENRKLNAENKIILNQLTFGERIESPEATKLPVLLAVALLKDRHGVIDIDLPVSGSLDDPQFSIGGIIWRIIVNIITKAVTAPFALLGAAFSNGSDGGEDLAYIEFDAGRAAVNAAAKSKITILAKALDNRPALNLEIAGRADALTDTEGLKRVGIEHKAKAAKLRDLGRRGETRRSLDEVTFEADEYARYLKAAYGDETFPKPRNLIGLAQDLPVPEMEKLMLQHAKVGEDDLRRLAAERAQTVRDALVATGQVSAERLFIVAAKPLSAEEMAKLKGRPNRVDFTMK